MSRRFGRNRRRRAREQLAQAALEITRANNGLADMGKRLTELTRSNQRMREEIDLTRRRLGQYTYFMSPLSKILGRPASDYGERVQVERKFPFKVEGGSHEMRITSESIPVMLARSRLDPFTGDLHLRVTYDDGQCGYAISRSAFSWESPDHIAMMVAFEMAPMLVGHIRRAGIGRI